MIREIVAPWDSLCCAECAELCKKPNHDWQSYSVMERSKIFHAVACEGYQHDLRLCCAMRRSIFPHT